MNQRCFAQRRRFGIDLLYPTGRYVEGLTRSFITPRFGGAEVPNPLYAPPTDGTLPRDPSMVFLAGIVGVPWQDISTEDSWSGQRLQLMTAAELEANGRWNVILGDPARGIDPTDPLMIESIDPREGGTPHPLLPNAAIVAPESSATNPINGREQQPNSARDDLQFACVYDLNPPLSAADCEGNPDYCDCNGDEFDKHSPLCEGTTQDEVGSQVKDKAYPALRELEVLRAVGSNAVVASACPKNVTASGDDPAADPNYGYNPAMSALVDRVKGSLTDDCLGPSLPVDAAGVAECMLLEARASGDCACDPATGRANTESGLIDLGNGVGLADFLDQNGLGAYGQCVCEIRLLYADDLAACSAADGTSSTAGFCYIDTERGVGDAALVGTCPSDRKRRLRFMGDDLPAPSSLLFLACIDQ